MTFLFNLVVYTVERHYGKCIKKNRILLSNRLLKKTYERYRLKHFTKYKKSVHYHSLSSMHMHPKTPTLDTTLSGVDILKK